MSDHINLDTINARLAEIQHCAGDHELAHSLEDRLFRDVLTAIAAGTSDNPEELAAAALRSHDIDFHRWCA
jgi:hypothetical protein